MITSYSKLLVLWKNPSEDFSSDVFNKYELANITCWMDTNGRWIPTAISSLIRREACCQEKSLAAGFFYVILHENHIKM